MRNVLLHIVPLQAKRHQPWEEADDDAVFAAAVLGELHDTIRVVGDVFRIVGDTAGALTGGSIKAVGAAVNVRRLVCGQRCSARCSFLL